MCRKIVCCADFKASLFQALCQWRIEKAGGRQEGSVGLLFSPGFRSPLIPLVARSLFRLSSLTESLEQPGGPSINVCLKARLHRRFLSRQLDTIFVAAKLHQVSNMFAGKPLRYCGDKSHGNCTRKLHLRF